MFRFAPLAALVLFVAAPAVADDAGLPPLPREAYRAMDDFSEAFDVAKARFTKDFFANAEKPDGSTEEGLTLAEAVANMRAAAQRVGQVDKLRGPKLDEIAAGFEQTIQQRIAAEVKCRATPSCMDERLTAGICGWIEQRTMTVAAIKLEKSNPAGVVDMHRLHELGETLQMIDAQIKAEKAKYVRAVKRPFAGSKCKG